MLSRGPSCFCACVEAKDFLVCMCVCVVLAAGCLGTHCVDQSVLKVPEMSLYLNGKLGTHQFG